MKIYIEAWMKVNDIKKDRMIRIVNDSKMGTKHYVHGNRGTCLVSLRTAYCISWLQFFIKAGDHQPDQKGIHLPLHYNVGVTYKKMEGEFQERGEKLVCSSLINNVWHTHFPKLLFHALVAHTAYRWFIFLYVSVGIMQPYLARYGIDHVLMTIGIEFNMCVSIFYNICLNSATTSGNSSENVS